MVDKNARYQNYMDAVSFISEAMIGNECINVTKPEVALELFADRSNFKLYMGDTGLLVTQIMKNRDSTDEDLYKALIIDNLGINQGMIVENIVAQMLRAAGHELYFHEYLYVPEGTTREKKYEIDFMIVMNIFVRIMCSTFLQHIRGLERLECGWREGACFSCR